MAHGHGAHMTHGSEEKPGNNGAPERIRTSDPQIRSLSQAVENQGDRAPSKRRRGYISWKTKYASALLLLGHVPYEHAKQMHEDQIISLYQVDHGILHAFDGCDDYWNLTPRLIAEHRVKSKADKKITSKAARIRGETCTGPRREIRSRGFEKRREPFKWPKRKFQNRK